MEFIWYFADVFTPVSLLLLIGGTVGGLILGATPGLSPTMAVALLIPFTFQLTPAHGLILLGATYTSTVAGGAVSAILLKIPGAPANIATTLDGHEMAKRGRGAEALQLSFLASAVGGVFGVLLLIFLTPLLAQWALSFGPSHIFWLAILGVTIIGSLDGSSVVKGLLSGCIGLWLSTIGFDDVMGAQRFIFHPALGGGVNVIAALIGLFAIPQVLAMLAKGRRDSRVEALSVQPHSLRDAVREMTRRTRALSIGTAVGSIIGLIPGVGGQIAGLVAYDQTRKFSATPAKFGTGHSEGVIAAESANNAMVGPSLVPLLTLSIPGSPTAAVLLGGLLIHGIFPGSDLFDNHPDVAWTFINSLLIGQVLMCLFGLWIAGWAAKVALAPQHYMAAAVLGLAVFGAYSVQGSMGDVYVMAALGFTMFVLERYGFSAAPLVLGLILGPIAEANFTQGAMIADATDGLAAYFFTGGLNIVLVAVVALSIAYSTVMEIRLRREAGGAPAPVPSLQGAVAAGLVAAVGAGVAWVSFTQDPADAFLFPRIVSTVFVGLAAWTFGKALLGRARTGAGLSAPMLAALAPGVIVALLYVFWGAKALGFYTAGALAFFALASLYDPAPHGVWRSWARRLLVTVCFVAVMYGLFAVVLGVHTPRDILF